MKGKPLQYFFYLFIAFSFLFSACKSQKPAFSNSSSTTTIPENSAAKPNTTITPQPPKTVAPPAPKLVYDSTKVSFKIKQKTETETRVSKDDDDEPTIVSSTKIDRTEKYRKREKEKGNWLSGGFLASGLILLAIALVLAIIGSGPAGLLALIGGVVLAAGIIFTMVALLGR